MRASAVTTREDRDLVVTVVISESDLERLDTVDLGTQLTGVVRPHLRTWRVKRERRGARLAGRESFFGPVPPPPPEG